MLEAEIYALRKENMLLKEELETFKNPGTCALKIALKYPSRAPTQTNKSESDQPKKRKNFPFARLLTNEESLQMLKEIDESAKSKAEGIKQRKEAAAQKRANQKAEKKKKKERLRKKRKDDHA